MLKATHKALTGQLRDALAAIAAGRVVFASDAHVESDIDKLGLANVDDYIDVIYECLQLAADDPVNCHRAPSQTHSTRHPASNGLRMWPFVVTHPGLKKQLYFKFCLRPDDKGSFYVHIDCHESRF